MPYTIICRHHRSGHNGRHPQQWETWGDAARELADVVEGLTARLASSLNDAEKSYVRMLVDKAARFGVAVLPGLVTYRVADVADAPPSRPIGSDAPRSIDWASVGRLARRAQRHTIELNNTAAVAAAEDPDFNAADRARATLNALADLCIVLHSQLFTAT